MGFGLSFVATSTAAFVSHTSGLCGPQSLARQKRVIVFRGDHLVFSSSSNNNNNNNKYQDSERPYDEASPKPKSRLAQLAEDWLEEGEEEDELQMYWERFEENKGNSNSDASPTAEKSSTSGLLTSKQEQQQQQQEEGLTTEQRLGRYFDRRGIHKSKEQKYAPQIEKAIAKAQSADTPEGAIAALEQVQAFLQIRTRLGGMALYELAVALWQRDGVLEEELVQELRQNPHVKSKVQQLARRDSPPPRSPSTKTFWGGLLESNQSWWS